MQAIYQLPIIAKGEEYLLERIGQRCGYLSHLNSNIKNLKDPLTQRNGEIIAPGVQNWVGKVDNININEDLRRFLDLES